MRRWSSLLLPLIALGLGCSSDPAPSSEPPFDHAAVFEVRERPVNAPDTPFIAEVPTLFRTSEVLPNLDVRALVYEGTTLYAGTADGVFRRELDGTLFSALSLPATGAVVDLAARPGELAVLFADRVVYGASGSISVSAAVSTPTTAGALHAVGFAAAPDVVWVGADVGLLRVTRAGATAVPAAQGFVVRDLVAVDGIVYLATANGVRRYDGPNQVMLPDWRAPEVLADDDVRALTASRDGQTLVVASATGTSKIDLSSGSAVKVVAGKGGLPTDRLTAVAEREGEVLIGHEVGATRVGAGSNWRIDHYHSLRWIPDQRVTAVAFDPLDGSRAIGTSLGVAIIRDENDTLARRAEANDALLHARHWRMDGFVDDSLPVVDPWALTEFRHTDHDNDGLWTEMQIGAWCYAYAVTKEPRYYEAAKKAVQVMFLEFDIPAKTFTAMGKSPGFITRSLVREDEGEIFENKATQSNWHLEEWEGRQYYWKDDTSSDEYAGHYFGLPIYYDLCAQDEAEKEEIRKRLRLSTDYLIVNDYRLIDLDGERTTHGHWYDLAIAVDGLDQCTDKYGIERAADCIDSRHGGGWLNGAEILGHLLATWHVTGDQKYYDEYERLFTAERYGRLIAITEDTFTVTEPRFANHSDHELAMLAYTTLLRYEPNVARRQQYVQSLLDFYEYERKEHNPWQVAVIGAYHAADVDLDGALRSLREMPTDWRTWTVDNTHRLDADLWPRDRHDSPQFNRVFPYDEIRTMKWNGNPYAVSGGSGGNSVLAPTPYLLAYWMQRYYGLIVP